MNTYLILGIIALVLVIVFAIAFSKKPTLVEKINEQRRKAVVGLVPLLFFDYSIAAEQECQ